MELEARIELLKKDGSFMNNAVAFSVVIFSLYMTVKMIHNTNNYTTMLYSGSLYMNSECI